MKQGGASEQNECGINDNLILWLVFSSSSTPPRSARSPPFSHSSFAAASQICSQFGLAAKASVKISLAAATSPSPTHFSFANINHKISAVGQLVTACLKICAERSEAHF